MKKPAHLSSRQIILRAEPKARLDYYELLRQQGKPCWYIRHGYQGQPYTDICNSPRAAWEAAADSFLAYINGEETSEVA